MQNWLKTPNYEQVLILTPADPSKKINLKQISTYLFDNFAITQKGIMGFSQLGVGRENVRFQLDHGSSRRSDIVPRTGDQGQMRQPLPNLLRKKS